MDNEQPQPKRRLAEVVAENISSQRQEIEADANLAAAEEDPKFDKRKGESNFGRRVAAKIALSQQQ